MDVQLYRLEVVKGKESIAEEWLAYLEANKEKAEKTLENEKVYFEAYFKEVIENQMYIYLFLMCKDYEFANNTALNSSNELDKKHFEYMKACIDLNKGNILSSEIFMDNLKGKF
ncbi:MAG: hypothetical protein F6K00_25270 [Leptolyngbya sp. SIOISBB]|nr:hypothetical protein [Leptolyngbya sp. SIOISBB]